MSENHGGPPGILSSTNYRTGLGVVAARETHSDSTVEEFHLINQSGLIKLAVEMTKVKLSKRINLM